jgi:EmrB/QacA subfamily drug resistance transporter
MNRLPDSTAALGQGNNRSRLLGVLCLCLFSLALDNSKLVVALPTLARWFGAGPAALKWVVEAYLLVYTTLLLLGGSLSERFGARRVLLAGATIFGAGSAAAATADSIGQLILWRGVMGVGGALLTPASLATIKHSFLSHERAPAIAIWTASFGVGTALGPVVSGWLLERYPWGSIMLANLPGAVAIFAGTLRLVPGNLPRNRVPLDLAGTVLALAATALFVYAVLEGPYLGWDSPAVFGAMGSAFFFYSALLAWEGRTAHPMLDLSLFRRPRFLAALSVIMLAYMSFSGVSFVLAQYLQVTRGYGPLQSGLFTVPLAAAMLTGTLLAPLLTRRFGEERALVVTLTTAALGAALLACASTESRPILLCAAEVLVGAGCGSTFANATDMVIGSVPEVRAGSAAAINETAFEFGGVLGVAILGTVQAQVPSGNDPGSPSARAIALGAGTLVAAVLVAWGARRAQQRFRRDGACPYGDQVP